MKKKGLFSAFTSLFVFGTLIISLAVSLAAPKWPSTITVQAGPSNSGQHTLGIIVADLISKYVKGVRASAVPSSGQTEACSLITRGDAELATLSTDGMIEMWNVEKGYIPGAKKNVREMFAVYEGYLCILVRADSNIKSITDLKNKKVMCLGSTSAELRFGNILEAYGMSYKDIRAVPRLTMEDQSTALKENTADCIVRPDQSPTAPFIELFNSIRVRWLPVDEDKQQVILNKYPKSIINKAPANCYPGIDKPVPTIGMGTVICGRTDLPDDLAYEIVKVILTHADDARKAAPTVFKGMNNDFAVSMPMIPFHAGAIKYFMEVGKWTPKLNSLNKEMLSEAGQTK